MNFAVQNIPNILDIVFKGLLIGIIASAPMGPVGILCVQRTLNKGRWFGFVTGCGAAVSDMIYAGITGLGMGLVVDFVNNDTNRFYLQIVGSLTLLAFGYYTYRTDPIKKMRKPGQSKGTLTHNAITAFLVTLSNPLIIFLFMALLCTVRLRPAARQAHRHDGGLRQHYWRGIALVVGPHLAHRPD